MDFRILGPLEVFRSGRRLQLGGHRQQTLLAFLLLNANRPVPPAELVPVLWESSPPPSAEKNVQLYISRIRRLLAGATPRLSTHGRSYRLAVTEGELDLDRCRRLARTAQHASGQGDLPSAERRMRLALSLWRGEPLAGLAGSRAISDEAERLVTMRVALHEEYFAMRLRAGSGADILFDLHRLVDAHPYRERLRGQLMHALWRTGDRSQALEVYRSGYRLLVDEVGVEPGRALRRLHEDILADRTELHAPRPDPWPPHDRQRPPGPLVESE